MEGYVRFIGPVPGKDGQWLGVQLDVSSCQSSLSYIQLQKGDMDGTVNGEYLFECGPNYGAILRPTQVKVMDNPQAEVSDLWIFNKKTQVEGGNEGGENNQGSRNQTTGFQSSLMAKMNFTANVDSQDQVQAKSSNWKDRIEEIKKKRQQDILVQQDRGENNPTDSAQEEQKKSMN